MHVKPDIPAITSGVRDDDPPGAPDATAALGRAARLGVSEPIGEGVAAMIVRTARDLLGPTWSGLAMTSPCPPRSSPRSACQPWEVGCAHDLVDASPAPPVRRSAGVSVCLAADLQAHKPREAHR